MNTKETLETKLVKLHQQLRNLDDDIFLKKTWIATIKESTFHQRPLDVNHLSALFAEIGVAFEGQIKKRFEDLVAFRTSVEENRHHFLQPLLQQEEINLLEMLSNREDLHQKIAELETKRADHVSQTHLIDLCLRIRRKIHGFQIVFNDLSQRLPKDLQAMGSFGIEDIFLRSLYEDVWLLQKALGMQDVESSTYECKEICTLLQLSGVPSDTIDRIERLLGIKA